MELLKGGTLRRVPPFFVGFPKIWAPQNTIKNNVFQFLIFIGHKIFYILMELHRILKACLAYCTFASEYLFENSDAISSASRALS